MTEYFENQSKFIDKVIRFFYITTIILRFLFFLSFFPRLSVGTLYSIEWLKDRWTVNWKGFWSLPSYVTVAAFVWRDWKMTRNLVMVTIVLVEIWTVYLPNTSVTITPDRSGWRFLLRTRCFHGHRCSTSHHNHHKKCSCGRGMNQIM